jgi:aminoglycoside phosphotransferase family enzyme
MSDEDQAQDVTTEQRVRFLSTPDAYPASVAEVQVKETHMNWVFLAGERVYKLKKPVRYPFLDFSTIDAREADCRAEVRLNRRLAPDVYRGVVPLVRRPDGELALGGAGRPVDWLVQMRRLPEQAMLDSAIARGAVEPRRVGQVADALAGFYLAAEPADVVPERYVAQFAREQAHNRRIVTDPRFDLPRETAEAVLSAVEGVLRDDPDLLADRARLGRIRDGHGDLRPEHVCLSDPPLIIDCLEFSRELRRVDPFDELSFLALECERLGAPWIGNMLIDRCTELLGDAPTPRLLAFYFAYRASLRARLALAHLLEPTPREPGRWEPLAGDYLAIAEEAALTLGR